MKAQPTTYKKAEKMSTIPASKYKPAKKIAEVKSFKGKKQMDSLKKKAITLKSGMSKGEPIDYDKYRAENKGTINITSLD